MHAGSDALLIPQAVLDAMLAHVQAALPDEACGLLGGQGMGIAIVLPVTNATPSPVAYHLDSRGQLNAMRELARMGLALVAIFHSHPASPAYPSPTDMERAFFPGTLEPNFPGAFYVIIGMADPARPDVRAYRITRDGAVEVLVRYN